MIKLLLARLIEEILNPLIALDENATERLRPHIGKAIKLTLTDLHQSIYFIIRQEKCHVYAHYGEAPDAHIQGTSFALLRRGRNPHSASAIHIEGDAELAQALQQFLSHHQIDWEEYLSYFTGDTAAHHIGNAAKNLKSMAHSVYQKTITDTYDFLHEEQRLLPMREEVEDFYEEVAQLRHDIARVTAKWYRLKGVQS